MIRARTTNKLKKDAEKVFDQLGLTASDAINLFYAQVSVRKAIPFLVEIPNEETLKTMDKVLSGKEIIHCEDADDMFSRLGI